MKKYVLCFVSINGFHKWPDAFEEVSYLQYKHRHVFEIKVLFETTEDREIEIIDTQNKIENYLLGKYGIKHDEIITTECDFGSLSCESIAEEILTFFKASRVEVTEDGFGGAVIEKEN